MTKAAVQPDATVHLTDANAWPVLKQLAAFPDIVLRAATEYEPSVIAKYALRLAKSFNQYYAHTKVLVDDEELAGRLALVQSVTVVLTAALGLLGVKAPAAM